jgi:SAM-dependent methyltransferase
MTSWLAYWNAPNSSYVSERHKRAHYDVVFAGVRPHLPSGPDSVVLDWGCGEALAAERMASIVGTVLLYDAAPSTRERLRQLHGAEPRIRILDEEALAGLAAGTADLVVVNSVVQYLTEEQLGQAFALFGRLIKPNGRLLVGDVIVPGTPMLHHITTFLGFALRRGFLPAAVAGLARTSASPYRRLHKEIGLAAYTSAGMIELLAQHGFRAERLPRNIAVSRYRSSYLATKAERARSDSIGKDALHAVADRRPPETSHGPPVVRAT